MAGQSLYRSYFRILYFSRLTLIAFWGCFIYFVVWAIPWLGVGLSKDDYTPQFLVTLIFAGACMLLGLLSATLRAVARQKREALVAWSSLYDEATGTRNRAHFYDRLALDCDRAEKHDSIFAVALLQMGLARPRGQISAELLRQAANHLKNLTRASDLVALIGANEFGVLLAGAHGEMAHTLAERLCASLAAKLPDSIEANGYAISPTIKVGVAVYGDDGNTPESLFAAARSAFAKEDEDLTTISEAA